jgi:hypothetical protein
MDKPYDVRLNLSASEKKDMRAELMQEVDDFVAEMVLWCDDKEDLLSLGSILLVSAKNCMTSAMELDDWKKATTEYVKRVGTENDLSLQAIKRKSW